MLLIISSDTAEQMAYRRLFYTHGVLTIAMTYREFLHSPVPPGTMALLLTDPYDKLMPHHFVYTCRTHAPSIPIVMMTMPLRDPPPNVACADIVLHADIFTSREFKLLLMELSRYHRFDIADLRYGSARDHLLMPAPTWDGIPFYLTPAERCIFRYLISAGGRTVTAKELLRYCTKPGTNPALSIISTHIHHINQKAQKEFHRHVIHCPGNIGYTLLTSD